MQNSMSVFMFSGLYVLTGNGLFGQIWSIKSEMFVKENFFYQD